MHSLRSLILEIYLYHLLADLWWIQLVLFHVIIIMIIMLTSHELGPSFMGGGGAGGE